jgi:hypothetical protein
VAAALEHHRGVDGKGYPELPSGEPPTRLVRLVSLASFVDRKRAAIDGRADDPEQVVVAALGLEGRYFEPGLVGAYTRALGIFPPGTTVELSSMDPALVVAANSSEPLRPRVVVLSGSGAGLRLDLADIDPVERRYITSIVRAIAPPLLMRPKSPTSHPPAALERPRPVSAPPVSAGATARRARPSDRPLAPRADPRSDNEHTTREETLKPVRRPDSARPVVRRLGPMGGDTILEITVNSRHLATLQLEPRESIVLSRVTGRTTLAEIAAALKIAPPDLLAIATRLLSRGVVRRT